MTAWWRLGVNTPSLQAFLDNFCQQNFVITPEGGWVEPHGANPARRVLSRSRAPFRADFFHCIPARWKTPGVISDDTVGDSQITYLTAALTRAKSEKFTRRADHCASSSSVPMRVARSTAAAR